MSSPFRFPSDMRAIVGERLQSGAARRPLNAKNGAKAVVHRMAANVRNGRKSDIRAMAEIGWEANVPLA